MCIRDSSSIRTPDRITDFRFGDDRIGVILANGITQARPTGFSRATDNRTADTLRDLTAAVFADADGGREGNQPLAAGAAALVVATDPAIAGTYLLINDSQVSPSLRSDLLLDLTGASGVRPALGVDPVSSVFA